MIAALIASHAALAEKPGGPREGKERHERKTHEHREHDRHESGRPDRDDQIDHGRPDREVVERGYFDDRQRRYANDYFGAQFRSGDCPPGLAKKHNGCLPPGQAKKWAIGRPLPRDVDYYDLPASVVLQLGMPPSGYRYVRVANDILLMATGTRLILDAITDLGR
ncbi:hypothetical protein JWZ97_03520 [Methylococcus sp. EFPC2]|nr:hypothetical protein JWZ97_03520 [Methylococcus sp. EFPC2]